MLSRQSVLEPADEDNINMTRAYNSSDVRRSRVYTMDASQKYANEDRYT